MCTIINFLNNNNSFLANDRDFGSIEMRIKKANYLYISEHYYELIELCRIKNPFLVERMKQKDFISTKQLGNSVTRKAKTYTPPLEQQQKITLHPTNLPEIF